MDDAAAKCSLFTDGPGYQANHCCLALGTGIGRTQKNQPHSSAVYLRGSSATERNKMNLPSPSHTRRAEVRRRRFTHLSRRSQTKADRRSGSAVIVVVALM